MKNIVELVFMCKIKETGERRYDFQGDFARAFFY